MSQKDETLTSKLVEEEKVIVIELEKMPDNTLREGNSIELPLSEALMRVDQTSAKFPELPIGVIPEKFI